MVPAGTAPAAGGYDDTNISIVVFDGWSSTTPIGGGSAFFVNAAVNPSCTIANGAVATDPVPVQIPVSMAGVVNTGAITRSYNQVVCNAPTDITMTSQNGGLINTVPASGGRTNVIPYSAQASFGGATSTLNTAASSMVTGKLNTTTGANGTMNVSISAQQPALPMMTGAYNDRLTITLTPQ